MRCLALAQVLSMRGWQCEFMTGEKSLETVPQLARSDHKVTVLTADCLTDPAALKERRGSPAALLVVDHYGLDAAYETPLRGSAKTLLVIDDLADRPHNCDILLDQTFGRDVHAYKDLVPKHCRILTTSRHALLRPEFAAQRQKALARRQEAPAVARILISMGMTDPNNDTCTALSAIEAAGADSAVDVILGPSAPHLPAVRNMSRSMSTEVTIHVDPDNVADLVTAADVAIGAGGSASWERCCLGLPTLVFTYGPVQKLVVRELERARAIVLVPPGPDSIVQRLAEYLHHLMTDQPRRREMAQAAAALCDGMGANRVARAIETLTKPRFYEAGH